MTTDALKPSYPREQFWCPGGYWIVLRPEIGKPGWIVRVLDYATWRHRKYEFDTETQARTEADRWRI